MAKPKRIFTDTEKRLIVALYELDRTDQEVADVLRINRRSFIKMLGYNTAPMPENSSAPVEYLSSIIKKVKGTAKLKVEASIYNRTFTSDTLAIFYAKTQMGWKETLGLEHSKPLKITYVVERYEPK